MVTKMVPEHKLVAAEKAAAALRVELAEIAAKHGVAVKQIEDAEDPESDGFKQHVRRGFDNEVRASKSIRFLTEQAKKKNKSIEVKWYPDDLEHGMTFYDQQQNEPTSNKAYCVLEIHDLHVRRDKRQRDLIKKANKETEFNILFQNFQDIWSIAREPQPKEYETQNGKT